MKKALISPLEPVLLGWRIAQVLDEEFPIAEPLFWVDCPDEVNDWEWYYLDGEFKKKSP